jgi:two-component system chemotaxis response regulator CheY
MGQGFRAMALTVLVVDDSATTRRILRTLLGSRHWTVCEAEGGCSGIKKFQRLKPDVVVLDLVMPDMNGLEAAKQMTASHPEIPIVLFTMLEIPGLERPAEEAGIRAIVTKNEAWNLIGSIESLVNQKSDLQTC